jgi:plastocyanin
MRRLAALFVIASLVIAASAYAATSSVGWKVGTNKTVKIKKGGSVKWVWSDKAPHNVMGPGFKSKTIAKKGFSFTHKFNKKGSFKITCIVHPNMKTTVKVG